LQANIDEIPKPFIKTQGINALPRMSIYLKPSSPEAAAAPRPILTLDTPVSKLKNLKKVGGAGGAPGARLLMQAPELVQIRVCVYVCVYACVCVCVCVCVRARVCKRACLCAWTLVPGHLKRYGCVFVRHIAVVAADGVTRYCAWRVPADGTLAIRPSAKCAP